MHLTEEHQQERDIHSTYSTSDESSALQLGDFASDDPTDELRKSAQCGRGPAKTGPSRTAKKAPPSLEPGWQTVRKQVIIAGRAWIYQHSALDDDGCMDIEWREELLFQHFEFWQSIHECPRIVGNAKLAKRIALRVARNQRRNAN